MIRVPAPLRDPRFRPFFTGRLVSVLGDSMAVVALSLAVLGASGRPGDLGVVLAAQILPHLVLLLVGGAVADRWSRRVVLLWSSLGSAATQGAVAALLINGHYSLGIVAGLQLFNGAIGAFSSPALRGIVPEVVPETLLQQANSLLSSTQNAVRILGPTVAALVVAAWGGGWAFALDALSFLVASVFLARVPITTRAPASNSTLLVGISHGWAALRALPWALTMIVSFAVVNMVNVGPWNVLGADIGSHGYGDAAWGIILSVRAAGLLVASIAMYRLTFRRLLVAGRLAGLLIGLPLVALGLSVPLPVVLGAVFVAGLGFTLAGITWETALQANTPREDLSKVSSYDDVLSFAAIPVGQLAVGPLTQAFGSHAVALWCGVVLSLAAAAPVLSRSVRDLRTEPTSD
ncbi:MFS transporter [Streptomyces sp. NPDC001982]|uniref:MFS transporter n=1 Tax=Streptomyces sp. NPDC001982 TaxID=3154405 RepID=UPI00332A278A